MKKLVAIIIVITISLSLVSCGSAKQSEMSWQDYLDLGQKYLLDGDYEQAIVAFEKAIEIEPNNVEAYIGLASAYIAIGDTENAVAVLKEALQIDDGAVTVYASLSEAYLMQDDYDSAIDILQKGYEKTQDEAIQDKIEELINGGNDDSNIGDNDSDDRNNDQNMNDPVVTSEPAVTTAPEITTTPTSPTTSASVTTPIPTMTAEPTTTPETTTEVTTELISGYSSSEDDVMTVHPYDILTLSGTVISEYNEINRDNYDDIAILELDAQLICYLDDGFDYLNVVKTIDSVQLPDEYLKYLGKHITVTGEVMFAHTGHHVRDIVLTECTLEP